MKKRILTVAIALILCVLICPVRTVNAEVTVPVYDSVDDAYPIDINTHYQFYSDDTTAYFTFSVTYADEGKELHLSARPDFGDRYETNIEVSVYDAAGHELKRLNEEDADSLRIDMSLSAGTYTIQIEVYGAGIVHFSVDNDDRTVTGVSAENHAKGIKVSWDELDGMAKYRLYRKDNVNKTWKAIKTVLGTSYIDTAVVPGTKYTYAVKGIGSNGQYTILSERSTVYHMARPVISSVANQYRKTKITWKKDSTVTKYVVLRKANSGNYFTIGETKNNYFVDNDVESGIKYAYMIYGVRGDYSSANSAAEVNYYVGIPSHTVKSSATGKINVSYGKVSSASRYEIQCSQKSDFSSGVKSVITANLSKTIALQSGKTYYVRVRAYHTVNSVNYYSAWKPAKTVTVK